jgi:hypothetical protein
VIFLSVCVEGILQLFTNFYLHRKLTLGQQSQIGSKVTGGSLYLK